MSSWRRGRRSPAATWRTYESCKRNRNTDFCWQKFIYCSFSHPELPLHQIGSCDHLGDGMFHLQPRVHLHEVKVMLGVHYKLHRTFTGRQTRCHYTVCWGSVVRCVWVSVCVSHLLLHSWQPWLLLLLLLQVSSEPPDWYQAEKTHREESKHCKTFNSWQKQMQDITVLISSFTPYSLTLYPHLCGVLVD